MCYAPCASKSHVKVIDLLIVRIIELVIHTNFSIVLHTGMPDGNEEMCNPDGNKPILQIVKLVRGIIMYSAQREDNQITTTIACNTFGVYNNSFMKRSSVGDTDKCDE